MCLRPNTCDQLIILDCAYARKAFPREAIGRRKFELLTSGAYDQYCRPGFTKQLSECMQRLLKSSSDGFSTLELYHELYHSRKADKIAGAPYMSIPLYFIESPHRDNDIIWLRPQRLQPKPRTLRNRVFMNVTFALDGYPDSGVTNEIARALRCLPHIKETRFEKLYDPRATFERVVTSVIGIQRLSGKMREMYAARKSRQRDSTMSGAALKRVATQGSSNNNLYSWKRPRPKIQE